MVSEPVNYFLLLRSMHESSGTEEELPMSDVASKILRNSVSALALMVLEFLLNVTL